MREKKINGNIGVSVIVPAFNEEAGIRSVLETLDSVMKKSGLEYEILVVDDGSSDGTVDIVQEMPATLMRHTDNFGYGAAIKTGIMKARHEYICITDADGTYPNERIPELVNTLDQGGYDMVVGARTGSNVTVPIVRKPAKWVIALLANLSVGVKIPDINSGLRVFKRNAALNFIGILPDGFSLTTTITLGMLSNRYAVKYVSIDYWARIGKSKIRPLRDTLNFVLLIARIALYFNPLKIFFCLSSILMIFGIIWGGVSFFVFGKLADLSTLVIALTAIQLAAIGLIAELVNHRVPNGYRKYSQNVDSHTINDD